MKAVFRRCPALRRWLIACVILAAVTSIADWPQYRGVDHDGAYRAGIRTNWTESPPAEVWRVPLDPGLSSLAIDGGRVFTQVRRTIAGQRREFCLALDAQTGAELWAVDVGLADYPNGGVGSDDGPRSTPAVAGDFVVVLASFLKLWCLDADSGAEIWSKDLRAEFGGEIIDWQNAASPIIVDGMVIVNGNGPGQCLLAFNIDDGTVVWKGHDDGMTHASPVRATIHGVPQVVFFAQSGLVGVAPATGAVLWRHPLNYNGISVAASPVVDGEFIYASRAYPLSLSAARAGAIVVRLQVQNDDWVTSQVWYRTNQLMNHWSTPVVHEGHIYGHFGQSSLTFKCVELDTGTEKWSVPGFGYGSVLVVGDEILVLSASGELVLVASDPEVYTEQARFRPLTGKCWNVPAVSQGRIYVRSTLEAVCVDVALAALPRLSLLTSPVVKGEGFWLRITTEDGSPIDPARATGIEVQTATDLGADSNVWTRLTNGIVLTNSALHVRSSEGFEDSRRYYRALEQP